MRGEAVAGLKHALVPPPRAAAHETEMAAMLAGHHLQDHGALAMPLRPDDRALVGPFHAGELGPAPPPGQFPRSVIRDRLP